MRISYLFPQLGFTGGNVVLYNFMDKLSERGYEVYAITPYQRIKWKPGKAEQVVKEAGMGLSRQYKLRTLAGRSLSKFPRVKSLVKIALRENKAPIDQIAGLTKGLLANWVESEITVSTLCFTSYANYALMDRTSPLYHMQHYEELFFNDGVKQKLARLTYFMPLNLISNSTWLRNQIKQRTGRDSCLLNPGISQKIFHPYQDVNVKYSNIDKIRIVSYSDTRNFKGWSDGVEAMRLVFSELGDDTIEWIVFGGYNSGELDIPVTYAGKVFNKDLARLYSSAHVVFMSSWYESFPLPPLEAMNCGTAVVTTRLGTEDYAHDGENSLVVPPRDPQQLADAIISLAQDPDLAARIAAKGLETAKSFTWGKAADKLEQILERRSRDYPFEGAFSDIADLASGDLVAQGYSESQPPGPK